MSKRKGDVDRVQTSAPGVDPVVLVRFVKRDAPFNAGDMKPLPPLEAQKFIRQGVAEEVTVG